MKTGLRNALIDLADDIFSERDIAGKDYGFGPYMRPLADQPTPGAMAAVLNDYISRKTKGRVAVVAVSMAMVAEPRSGRHYFRLAPPQGSLDEELSAPRYFSIPSYGDGHVLFHDGVSPDEVSVRLAGREAFESHVQHITAGEGYAAKLQMHLINKVQALISVAVRNEHGHGLTYRLEAAARIVGTEDLYRIDRSLDGLDLPTLCAVLAALGATDELDYL